jgi:tRNA-splicing ligase RtcB (3'-phosphate/5'-hydroxy nucleic acid ligase)
MPIQKVLEGRVPVKIWTQDVEAAAETQLLNTAALPFVFKHVAAMPDVHAGKGSTIGSVIATKGAISPAAVGVDIGCGMMAVKLDLKQSTVISRIKEIRALIEKVIPVGFNSNKEVSDSVARWYNTKQEILRLYNEDLLYKSAHQLGTLGGGNHFIEICLDKTGLDYGVWVMLHSGSRNIGNEIAKRYIEKAKKIMDVYFIKLDDPDLAYLAEGTKDFEDYLNDLHWCQDYALANREEMMRRVIKVLSMTCNEGIGIPELMSVNCHHNYVALENHFGSNVLVTRKGAVRARQGDLGIIPGSMGTGSFITRGLGNPESFNSCSHGAGRKMSRTRARAEFNVADLTEQTKGVECRKDAAVIDEIPGAYKDINQVMADQVDLVEVVAELKQILCVKG